MLLYKKPVFCFKETPQHNKSHNNRSFARRCGENIALRLLVFDFEGQFLFEEKRGEQKEPEKNGKIFSGQSDPSHASASSPEAPTARSGEHAELSEYNGTIGLTYFLDGKKD